ncbi:MAG: class I SAM-dependent methyltransferase [Deltaproteobacteria bacterium]|nr:class I SAM-dependent methyltransferase [Myxococcales bacterium]MDP3214816.1 class I SAM-dependent methyltransferase [Deltaproteobacteria bacterium]
MTPPCPRCRRDAPRRFTVRSFDVHRCARCDLEFVWPTPSPEALASVYTAGYFEGGGAGYADYFTREREQVARKSRARLAALRELGVTRGRLFDLGCAAGYFLGHARDAGFTVAGAEPSPEALAAMDPSLRAAVVPSLDALDDAARFEVVTAWDVLEHLPDPDATLRSLRARLTSDGLLAVVIPVIGSTTTRLAPRRWDQYKPPEHLWFWSARAMRGLLADHGLRVVREDVAWRRPSRFIDPDGASRSPVVRLGRALDALGHRALAAVAGPHVVTDSVAFYARVGPS